MHLTGEGPTNAVALQLAVQVPHLNGNAANAANAANVADAANAGAGDAAGATSSAILDLDARTLRVAMATCFSAL